MEHIVREELLKRMRKAQPVGIIFEKRHSQIDNLLHGSRSFIHDGAKLGELFFELLDLLFSNLEIVLELRREVGT